MTNLLFFHENLLDEHFSQTDLGILYKAIPFEQLSATIPSPRGLITGQGRKSWFDVRGGIGLMILKHVMGVSDRMLIDRINTDWCMQLFCGIRLRPGERIKDSNLPSWWRSYIGQYLDMDAMQQCLADYWKPWIKDTAFSFEDATCYESYIAHPTDCKLLWGACKEVYALNQLFRKQLKLRKSRSNYEKHKTLFLNYQRCRKKSRRKERKLRKQLLGFLYRLLQLNDELQAGPATHISKRKATRLKTIRTLYEQQHNKAFGDKNPQIKDRIVSISKPYIRPIIRGKEIKAVEFGAKVNKLQVDGISFIQRLSYDAFNEGTQLVDTIYLHRKLFGKCTHHSADAIYATNANRKYCRQNNITTNFIPKGRQKPALVEQSKTMRAALNRQRGTVLEGSFGNEKNHYHLNKIKARNQSTETCWIFFGILTANASIISKRMQQAAAQIKSRAA